MSDSISTRSSANPDSAGRLTSWIGSRLTGRRREIALFLIFGALNTLISYAIYLTLLAFSSYMIAYTVSHVSGIFVSYFLNTRFVFRETLRLSRALQYPIVYFVQYLVGLVLMYVLVELLHVSAYLAPFAVVALTLPVTYSLSRYVIKR